MTHRPLFRPAPPALAALLLPLLALYGCQGATSASPPEPQPASPVRVAAAFEGPAQPPIASAGLVAAEDEMRLSFKVGGIVRSIAVREGESVRKGQKLAEIEQTEIGAQVEQARQLADKAQRDLERGERLHADQVISLEQLQDLRTQASVARAALRAASFNLGYSTILAPRDGIVLRRLVEEREVVPAGEAVLELGARDAGYVVKTALADREIVQLRLGDRARIRLDAYPLREFTGAVTQIAGGADERSGMFPIEVRIEDPPSPLASGLVARVDLEPSAALASRLTHVPVGAIVEGDRDRAYVFVVQGERAMRRSVRVAFVTNQSVAVLEGVRAGETVVTDGALYLEDRDRVRIVKAGAEVAGQPPGASAG